MEGGDMEEMLFLPQQGKEKKRQTAAKKVFKG